MAAGVSRSTFYQHFSGEPRLAFRLAAPAMADARAAADGWWREPTWRASADLVAIVRTLIAQGREHRLAWLAFFDVADRDPESGAAMETPVRDYVAQMAERITREQRRGATSPGVNTSHLGRLILITTRACVLDHLAHGDPADDAALADTLGHVLWLALRYPDGTVADTSKG